MCYTNEYLVYNSWYYCSYYKLSIPHFWPYYCGFDSVFLQLSIGLPLGVRAAFLVWVDLGFPFFSLESTDKDLLFIDLLLLFLEVRIDNFLYFLALTSSRRLFRVLSRSFLIFFFIKISNFYVSIDP